MYGQIKKNTVDAKNQLKVSEDVRFEKPEGNGIRVMFVGNSITLHGIKEDIGWVNEWGMAASSKEKDYVHLLMNKILQKDQDATFCICQVAKWEQNYKQGTYTHELFEDARDFNADIIIMRLIENCTCEEFDAEIFEREYKKLVDYLNKSGNAKIILTGGFWHHPGDEKIEKIAIENGYSYVTLGDLGERDDTKALGLFWHEGVSVHPGDFGMMKIAERISKFL